MNEEDSFYAHRELDMLGVPRRPEPDGSGVEVEFSIAQRIWLLRRQLSPSAAPAEAEKKEGQNV